MGKLQQPRNGNASFANGSKSIIINSLRLCKHSEIQLIQNFQKHCHGSNGIRMAWNVMGSSGMCLARKDIPKNQ